MRMTSLGHVLLLQDVKALVVGHIDVSVAVRILRLPIRVECHAKTVLHSTVDTVTMLSRASSSELKCIGICRGKQP